MDVRELTRVCMPVVAFMQKNCTPHDTLVITGAQFKIVTDTVSIPVSGYGVLDIDSCEGVRWMEQQLITDEFVAMTKKLIQQVMDEREMGRIYPEFIREIRENVREIRAFREQSTAQWCKPSTTLDS